MNDPFENEDEMQSVRQGFGGDLEDIKHIVDNNFVKEPENGIISQMRSKYRSNCRKMK